MKLRKNSVLCMLALGILLGGVASADIHHLASDWSGVANPNGAWPYESAFEIPQPDPLSDPSGFMESKTW